MQMDRPLSDVNSSRERPPVLLGAAAGWREGNLNVRGGWGGQPPTPSREGDVPPSSAAQGHPGGSGNLNAELHVPLSGVLLVSVVGLS